MGIFNLFRTARRTGRSALRLEALEDRAVPATLTPIAGGVLSFADSGNHAGTLTVELSGSNYIFTTNESINNSPSNTATVPAASVNSIRIDMGALGDSVTVKSTNAPITVVTGDGDDTVTLGAATGLDLIKAKIAVNPAVAVLDLRDTLVINDQGTSAARNYTVTNAAVTRALTPVSITYAGVKTLSLTAGGSNDSVRVESTIAATTIATGAGNDTITVGNTANKLDNMQGSLHVNGGTNVIGGSDKLVLLDSGSITANTYYSATGVGRQGMAGVTYDALEGLTITAGSGADTVNVTNTKVGAPLTINTGPGSDKVNVGSGALPSLGGLKASVTIDGGTGGIEVLNVNDIWSGSQTFAVEDTRVMRLNSPTIHYSKVTELVLNTGYEADTIDIATSATAPKLTVNAGKGDDTVKVGAGAGGLGKMTINGNDGIDTLQVNDTFVTGGRNYVFAGTKLQRAGGEITYGTLETLEVQAGPGNDTFSIQSPAVKPVVKGGQGSDTVDYSAVTSAVVVDLRLGKATNLAGMTGIENATGGAGNDDLIGDDAANVLKGNGGDDKLFGDGGDDELRGGAGNDRLFGGSRANKLYGETGKDRFLKWAAGDAIQDLAAEDAVITFRDGAAKTGLTFTGQVGTFDFSAGTWSAAEILQIDVALGNMHAVTANTRLLKKANGGDIIFERIGEQLTGLDRFRVGAYNSGGLLVFPTVAFDDPTGYLLRTVYHETGHNWDHPSENAFVAEFRAISGWKQSATDPGTQYTASSGQGDDWFYLTSAANTFSREYGKTNPLEDYATSWESYFMQRYHILEADQVAVATKIANIDKLFTSLQALS